MSSREEDYLRHPASGNEVGEINNPKTVIESGISSTDAKIIGITAIAVAAPFLIPEFVDFASEVRDYVYAKYASLIMSTR